MIISASRRTDIPAYFSEWFINRLKAEYVLVRNPMNPKAVSKINLNKDNIDCIVFWTKNPKPLMKYLDYLNNYNFYFHFTINPYDKTIEPNVPKKSELIDTFITLSEAIGKNRVIWRYTPILFVKDKIDLEYHKNFFKKMLSKIAPYTNVVKIGAVEMYQKTKRNSIKHNVNIVVPNDEELIELSIFIKEECDKVGIKVERCVERLDLDNYGIYRGKCIDNDLISEISDLNISYRKDKNQRKDCNCMESADIGMYHSCPHKCVYCYANTSFEAVDYNYSKHNANSPLLFGELNGNEIIKERKIKSLIKSKTLF